MTISPSLFVALLLFGACIFIAQSILFWLFISKNKKQEKKYAELKTQLGVLRSGCVGMGQKMIELEIKFRSLQELQNEMKHSDLDYSYTQAEKLVAEGIDNDAIAINSGLSSSEIQLIRLMQTCRNSQDVFA